VADVTINGLTATTAPDLDDELELQLAGGGASRKVTRRYLLAAARTLNPKTSGYTINATDTGEIFTNAGASAAITGALPAAAAGLEVTAVRVADYEHRLDPDGTDTISGGGAGKYLSILTTGSVTLRCVVANAWIVVSDSALWRLEP